MRRLITLDAVARRGLRPHDLGVVFSMDPSHQVRAAPLMGPRVAADFAARAPWIMKVPRVASYRDSTFPGGVALNDPTVDRFATEK